MEPEFKTRSIQHQSHIIECRGRLEKLVSEDETLPHPTGSKPKVGLAVDLKGSETKPFQGAREQGRGDPAPQIRALVTSVISGP